MVMAVPAGAFIFSNLFIPGKEIIIMADQYPKKPVSYEKGQAPVLPPPPRPMGAAMPPPNDMRRPVQRMDFYDEDDLDLPRPAAKRRSDLSGRQMPGMMKDPTGPMESPPLFIKIEKYRDVVRNLMEIKSFVLNLRDALDVMDDIQREISNGVNIAKKTLDELNMLLSNLDSYLVKPESVDRAMAAEPYEVRQNTQQTEELENYVKDVYGQLEKLKTQLKSLS